MNKAVYFKGLVLALVTVGIAWYSHYYLLGWSAALPPWKAALESSKSLGYTDERYEFVFFLVTFYLPYALISVLVTLFVTRFSGYWVAPAAYGATLYYLRGLNFYDWGAPTLAVLTMVASFSAALVYKKHLTRRSSKL